MSYKKEPAVCVERMHFSVPRAVADHIRKRSTEFECSVTEYLICLMCDCDVWSVVIALDQGGRLIDDALEKAASCPKTRYTGENTSKEQTRSKVMSNQNIRDEMVQINLRVTKEQKEQITQKASQMGMSLSGYLIYVATLDMFDITEKLREINDKLDELRQQVDDQQVGEQ